jgi:hypothetical protein
LSALKAVCGAINAAKTSSVWGILNKRHTPCLITVTSAAISGKRYAAVNHPPRFYLKERCDIAPSDWSVSYFLRSAGR